MWSNGDTALYDIPCPPYFFYQIDLGRSTDVKITSRAILNISYIIPSQSLFFSTS